MIVMGFASCPDLPKMLSRHGLHTNSDPQHKVACRHLLVRPRTVVLGWEVAFIRGMILPSSRDQIVHDLGHHLGGDSSLRVRLRRDRWPLFSSRRRNTCSTIAGRLRGRREAMQTARLPVDARHSHLIEREKSGHARTDRDREQARISLPT